ncbi:MAG: acetyl-coenzyme A synthetase N-terminal domain-containing protein, partial [Halobacteriaceae archaeon]
MTDSPVDTDRIAYEPSEEFVEASNVHAFMQEHGIDDFEDLHERTVREVDGVEASGLDWFWDEVVDYLDLEFYEDYDQVRDATDGPQFTDWYVGGELNIAHNVVDRHAQPDSPNRNKVACIWEGEPHEGEQIDPDDTDIRQHHRENDAKEIREVTYHEL